MADPIRILHVVHSLEPGGMEHVLTTVAQHLAPRGFDVHVCCLEDAGQLAERLPEDHIHPIRRDPGFRLSTIQAVRRQIRELRPDLIHTHNYAPLLYTAPAACWAGASNPCVSTL